MGLSTQDFVVAFRALSTQACSPSDLRKALRVQSSRFVQGKRLTLSESLVEARSISPFTAGELASPAPVHLRGDPEALTAAGELFLATETASELELDRIVDGLTRPVDPRTLKEVPVPPSLKGYDVSWEIGRSRTGSVYRGSKRGTTSPVAIKVFRADAFATDAAKAAFLERMAAGSADDGPGVIKVLEARDVDGQAVVVQEFVEGAPLDKLLAERKVSLRRGFEIMGRAALLVAPSHGKGVAHGRLSARGILVQPNDHPRIDGSHRPE
ncbi:MAG TPA: protein kinase, partial [Planctomycetota bacterium]|nr:protein kinase [Planctomycetota bacterium]